MKVIKESINNVERALHSDIDVVTNLPIVMTDAIIDSEATDKAIEDEIGKRGAVKDIKPFLGADSLETPKMPKVEMIEMDESLFEDLDQEVGFDLNSDVYNALERIWKKYSRKGISKNDLDAAYEWFTFHFEDYDDEADPIFVGESLKKTLHEADDDGPEFDDWEDDDLDDWEGSRNLDDYDNKESRADLDINKDLWSKVWEELCPSHPSNFRRVTRVAGYDARKDRYDDDHVEADDTDIIVYAADEGGLQLAKDVANEYGLDYRIKNAPSYVAKKHPEKAVQMTLIIPEDEISGI